MYWSSASGIEGGIRKHLRCTSISLAQLEHFLGALDDCHCSIGILLPEQAGETKAAVGLEGRSSPGGLVRWGMRKLVQTAGAEI